MKRITAKFLPALCFILFCLLAAADRHQPSLTGTWTNADELNPSHNVISSISFHPDQTYRADGWYETLYFDEETGELRSSLVPGFTQGQCRRTGDTALLFDGSVLCRMTLSENMLTLHDGENHTINLIRK